MKIAFFIIAFFLVTKFSFAQEIEDLSKEDTHPILSDKFMFNTGIYFSTKFLKIGVNGQGQNEIIDFNEAFDLNNNEVTFLFNFIWRFSKKWSLSAEYFSIRNGNKWELEEDIYWGDVTFKEGSDVKVGFGLDMYRIFVGRSLLQRQHHDFGVGLGVHDLQISAYITGNAYINDDEYNFEKKSISVNAPLPNIGFWYFYAPNSKWGLSYKLDWFGITVGEYSGSLWNVAPSVNYQVFKHVGLGLSYRYFKFTAKVNKQNWDGRFDMVFHGPLFSISGNF